MNSSTYTESSSSTYTESRARVVMRKVFADLLGITSRGFLALDRAQRWVDEIKYCLDKEAVEFFEIQFRLPSGESKGLQYEVSDDGTLSEDSRSGGMDYFDLPDGTKVHLVVRLKSTHRHLVVPQLTLWGWGFNGTMLEGQVVRDHAYSKSGYGMIRKRVGEWS
jgi:hypothetical protein